MNKSVFNKVAVAAGAVLALAVGNAFATPEFTVNQGAIAGGTYQAPQFFTGTQFSGNASELIRFSAGDTQANVNSGFLRFSSIFNENTASGISLNTSSVGGNYGLYVLFNFAATYNAGLSSGGPGTPGSEYDITALSFTFYADTQGNTTFQTAQAAGAGTEANRSGGFGDDVVLAFGSLLNTANPDVAGFDIGGGAFENSLTSFAVCTGAGTATTGGVPVVPATQCLSGEGNNYFSQPIPFYPLAFNTFNNTGNSLTGRVGNNLAVSQSVGAVSFEAVPEPSTVALLGIAGLGLGLASRRRRKA